MDVNAGVWLVLEVHRLTGVWMLLYVQGLFAGQDTRVSFLLQAPGTAGIIWKPEVGLSDVR